MSVSTNQSLFKTGMQNLAISCSVVCLIILVACLLVFWVGLIERQVPPILVVSVLYLLAGKKVSFLLIKNICVGVCVLCV